MTNVSPSKNWTKTSCCHEAAVSKRTSARIVESNDEPFWRELLGNRGDLRSSRRQALAVLCRPVPPSEIYSRPRLARLRGGPSAPFHNGRSYEHSGLPHSNFYAEARGVAGCSERAFANSPPLLDVVVTPEAVFVRCKDGACLGSRSPAISCRG